MDNSKLVIFDFDGTIADTLEAAISVLDELAEEGKIKPYSKSDLLRWRKMDPKAVLKETGLSWWQVPLLLISGRNRLKKHAKSTTIFEGMKLALQEVAQTYPWVVISTNSHRFISEVFELHGITGFGEINGGGGLFGKHRRIKQVMKKYKLDPSNVVLVTDEIRDLEAAKKCDIHCITITWGYQDRETILNRNPEYCIDSPQELPLMINKIFRTE